MTTDPFSAVYAALWAGLESFADFAALVKVRNRLRFDVPGVRNPTRETSAPADLPELTLLQGAFRLAPYTTNALACDVAQAYPVVIAIDDLQVVKLNAVKWQAFRALLAAGHDLGLPYVRRWTIEDGRDDPAARRLSGDARRWAAVLTINVEMSLSKADIAAGALPS